MAKPPTTSVLPRPVTLGLLMLCLSGLGCAPKAPPVRSTGAAPAVVTPAPAPAQAPRGVLEPRALQRLKAMSDTLARARVFSFTSSSSVEVPAKTGQYLTFFTHSRIAVERPNRFRLDQSGDIAGHRIVYDRSKVQGYDPEKKLYALTDAPGSIDETLRFLRERFGIHFHAADLMVSDPYAVLGQGLSSALFVGPAQVDGVACDHLAFRAPGIDWEIWVESGKEALPRRFAVTYTDAAHFPRFLVDIRDWDLKPRLSPGYFAMSQPSGSQRIAFDSAAARQAEKPVPAAK